MDTKFKEEYTRLWKAYINECRLLDCVKDELFSIEVNKAINKLIKIEDVFAACKFDKQVRK